MIGLLQIRGCKSTTVTPFSGLLCAHWLSVCMSGFRSWFHGALNKKNTAVTLHHLMSDNSLKNTTSNTAQAEPLGLTVHAIPVPEQDGARNKSGRWKMIAVLLVCASPVIASYFTYYVVRPEGRRNYGELVNPQRPLPVMATTDLNGKPGELTALKNQWLLINVASASCDAACQQRLYLQRQLRESLGKNKNRLERIWLITDTAAVDVRLQPALTEAVALRVAADAVAQWLPPAASQRVEDHLYVVDPLGNLMMRFPANMDAAGAAKAKRDLDRLLRASGSWDTEGR